MVELILVMNANADWFPGLINWIISPLLTGRAVCQGVRQWSWNLFDMIVNVVIVKRSLKTKANVDSFYISLQIYQFPANQINI